MSGSRCEFCRSAALALAALAADAGCTAYARGVQDWSHGRALLQGADLGVQQPGKNTPRALPDWLQHFGVIGHWWASLGWSETWGMPGETSTNPQTWGSCCKRFWRVKRVWEG